MAVRRNIFSPQGLPYGNLLHNNQKDLYAMTFLHALVHCIDTFTDYCGRLLAWLIFGMAVLTTLVVVLRYGFSMGAILAQEAVVYMHGSVFLLGAAYALKTGSHVRVDIFYRYYTVRRRAWIDSLGGIVFLLPLCAFILVSSWGYVAESWAMRETSAEPGGIPAVFLLKTLIPLMAINLALQGVAEVLRNAAILTEEPVR